MVSCIPRALAIPFTKVVFPAPRVPWRESTSPGINAAPISSPALIVSSALFVIKVFSVFSFYYQGLEGAFEWNPL